MDDKPTIKPGDTASPASQATELSGNAAGQPDDGGDSKRSLLRRLVSFGDKYFFVFLVLVIIVGVATYLSLNKARKSATKNPTTNSLTNQQIAELKGSTTVVGDSQQTLDVQSNSVFEGSVLMRNSLDVAGSIKVGGSISLSSITIGGTASFGQVQINGALAVTGNTTMQGLVNIQKNLTVAGSGSFGSLSTSQLNASSLQLAGDLTLSHHIVVSGGSVGRSNGGALGSGGTTSVSGSDTSGTVTINTGSGAAAGCFLTVNFTQRFSAIPKVIISPSNSSAGSMDYYTNRSNTGFSICDSSTPAIATTYIFDYFVAG